MTPDTNRQFELTIAESIRYHSTSDEDCFFAWLKSVPGFVSVIGSGRELHIRLATPIRADTVSELAALFKRYGINADVLQQLKPE
jgi:hypothetical protein